MAYDPTMLYMTASLPTPRTAIVTGARCDVQADVVDRDHFGGAERIGLDHVADPYRGFHFRHSSVYRWVLAGAPPMWRPGP